MKGWLLIALLLAGCAPTPAVEAVQDVALPVATDVALATTVALDSVLPAPQTSTLPVDDPVSSAEQATIDLILRWEIGSPAQYNRRYQHPICPGGHSGPTVGIGADLGTQTEQEIRASWGAHPDIEAMVTASGQTGPTRCHAWLSKYRSAVRVTYPQAADVFAKHDWPRYRAMAARAYRNGWDGLSEWHQGGLGSNGYNRGFSFLGSRRTEMREIRDNCVPYSNALCTGAQLRASCRVWEGTRIYKGLCNRRKDEAQLVETGA